MENSLVVKIEHIPGLSGELDELRARVKALENMNRTLGPSPDSPSPYDLTAVGRLLNGQKKRRGPYGY